MEKIIKKEGNEWVVGTETEHLFHEGRMFFDSYEKALAFVNTYNANLKEYKR